MTIAAPGTIVGAWTSSSRQFNNLVFNPGAGAVTLGGNVYSIGNVTVSSGSVTGTYTLGFNGTAITQTLASGGNTWYGLAVNGTTNTLQLQDTTSVSGSGSLTVASGTYLDLNGQNFGGSSSTVTQNGTVKLFGTETITGTNYSSGFGSGAVVLEGSGTYTGTGGLTQATSLTVASGTHSLSGAFLVTGAFSISGGTLAIGSNNLTVNGNFSAAGTNTFTQGTGSLILSGSSAQTITPGSNTYGAVTVGNSALATGVTNNALWTVGALTVGDGTNGRMTLGANLNASSVTLNAGATAMNLNGNTLNATGGLTIDTGTVTVNTGASLFVREFGPDGQWRSSPRRDTGN